MTPSEYMAQHEWIQHQLFERNHEGEIIGCCLLGAIDQGDYSEKVKQQQDQLSSFCLQRFGNRCISEINDTFIHSKEEAVALLKEAGL